MLTAVVGGEVLVALADAPPVAGHLKAGQASGRWRSPPAERLAGLPGRADHGGGRRARSRRASVVGAVRAGRPRPTAIVKKLREELIEIIRLPDVRERLMGLPVDPARQHRAALAAMIAAGLVALGDDRQGRQHQARLGWPRHRMSRGQPPARRWPQPPPTCCWRRCSRHGIEYFFANPGTDFPPIVEGFARAKASGGEGAAARSWCRTRTSPWPWRTAPT